MLRFVSSKEQSRTRLADAVSVPSAEHFSELRRSFLMEHRRPVYYCLLADGQLDTHLKAIGNVAEAELDRQIAKLKAFYPGADPLAIRDTAERIVMDELICC